MEIKIKIKNPKKIEDCLKSLGARFVSEVEVKDIYFKTKKKESLKIGLYPKGHLPEAGNFLLYFSLSQTGKSFQFKQVKVSDIKTLKFILTKVLGIKAIIKSRRKFYKLGEIIILFIFIENLGWYLCLQGEKKRELEKVFNKLGLKKEFIESRPFSELGKSN